MRSDKREGKIWYKYQKTILHCCSIFMTRIMKLIMCLSFVFYLLAYFFPNSFVRSFLFRLLKSVLRDRPINFFKNIIYLFLHIFYPFLHFRDFIFRVKFLISLKKSFMVDERYLLIKMLPLTFIYSYYGS